jgi:hypothetical protein
MALLTMLMAAGDGPRREKKSDVSFKKNTSLTLRIDNATRNLKFEKSRRAHERVSIDVDT